MDRQTVLQIGRRVIAKEAEALYGLTASLNDTGFYEAANLLYAITGHVIILGVGKSGHIGRKICSSLSSTGTPSFFIHPVEAKHGDLGMMKANDAIIFISYSGRTDELINLVPYIKRRRIPMIAITGDKGSPLARSVDIPLSFDIKGEACLFNIVPTVSVCVTLAIGDALTIALMEMRGFSDKDFSNNHPSGNLGRILAAR